MMQQNDKMLTYKEAADFIGVNISTLYSMVCRGEIEHFRYGKRLVRFSKKELLKMLEESRVKNNSKEAL